MRLALGRSASSPVKTHMTETPWRRSRSTSAAESATPASPWYSRRRPSSVASLFTSLGLQSDSVISSLCSYGVSLSI